MGGFKIIEDRPTPKCVYNARVYLQATVVGESPCELLGLILLATALTRPSIWRFNFRL